MSAQTKSESHDFSHFRKWSNANSHHILKAHEKSPGASPPISRNNSVTSLQSTQSEPGWSSSYDRRNSRKDSNASTQTTDSHKKGGLMGMFSKDKKPKEKKPVAKIVLGSRHATAVKTKLMMDPTYKELTHNRSRSGSVDSIDRPRRSSHTTAAEQEARHPHSGPPALHTRVDSQLLTRIESREEPDYELDRWEQQRLDWNLAHESSLNEIPELRSRQNSTKASPIHSKDSSPNRSGAHSKHPSWSGRYHRNQDGRWTSKDGPTMTHSHNHGNSHPDALVNTLTQKLNAL